MKFRELFFNKIFTLRNLFFVGNFLILFLFLGMLAQDALREWKPYQRNYRKREVERLTKMRDAASPDARGAVEDELKHARRRGLEIKQILANDLNRVDRCITCHLGYDSFTNPALVNDYPDPPYAAPKNDVHAKHPFEKYGCTVCHEGQGLATDFVNAAHMPKGEEQKAAWKKKYHWRIAEFWEAPMKAGPLIYASCFKCHEAPPAVPGVQIVKGGKQIAWENGCIGCHQVRGEGGPIAPDLALETSVKPLARIDFGPAVTAGVLAREDRSLENWIRLHFATAPAVLTPGDPEGHLSPDPKHPQPVAPSAMPYFGFDRHETESLVAYVTSLKSESLPYPYRVSAPKEPEPRFASAKEHGRYVYLKYGCAGCHGKNADRGIPVYNRQGQRAPDLVKVVGTYTKDELVKKIQEGVNPEAKEDEKGPTPPLYMPAFRDRVREQEMDDLSAYLFSIAEKTEEW